jgi:hypothetical protein
MSVKFELKAEQLDKITDAIKQAGADAETAINTYLQNTAPDLVKTSITDLIPISNRTKKHAKTSNPFEHQNFNLALSVKSRSPFYYLKFINDGTGTSKGKNALEFMERGLDAKVDEMTDGMLDEINNIMTKRW